MNATLFLILMSFFVGAIAVGALLIITRKDEKIENDIKNNEEIKKEIKTLEKEISELEDKNEKIGNDAKSVSDYFRTINRHTK